MGKLTKVDRVAEANRVLQIISNHGRRFFFHKERISQFEVDARGMIWFRDSWTDKPVYTHYNGRWKGFSEGGTLRSLVIALRDYIRTGEPISARWFGPWPQHICDGDLWGYGPSMDDVRSGVLSTAAVTALTRSNKDDRHDPSA